MNVKKVGEFIKQKRKEKKLTQKELAEKLSITDRAISKWERGICCPDISILKELSSILEVSVNELLAGEEIEKLEKEKTDDVLVDSVKQYTSIEKKKNKKLLIITIIFVIFCMGLVFAMYLTYNQVNKNDNINWHSYSNKKILDKFFVALENYDYETIKEMEFESYNTGQVEDTLIEDVNKCDEYKEQRKNGERLSDPGIICKLKYFEDEGLKFLSHEYLYQSYINGTGEWATMYDFVVEYKGNKLNYTFSGFVRNGIIAETSIGKVGNEIFDKEVSDMSNRIFSFFNKGTEWEE